MASEEKVSQYAREAGYEPLEDRCIIVKPAPGDLSEKIVAFFKSIVECELCVLQMCEHELILLPFDRMWTYLKKDVSLVLPYKDIQAVEVEEDLLNFVITIRTEEDTIRLTNAINRGLEKPERPEDVAALILQGISARYACFEAPAASPDTQRLIREKAYAQAIKYITITAENAVTVTFK